MNYIDVLLEAIGTSRRSAREISIAAVGHASAVRNLRQRRDVRASTLEALCRELGLEFYIGPDRAVSSEIAKALELPHDCSVQDVVTKINLQEKAGPSATIRSLVALVEQIASDLREHRQETSEELAEVRRATTEAQSQLLATMLEEETTLATQASAEELSESPEELIYFDAFGDSMDPTIAEGALVMLVCSQHEPINGAIFLIYSESRDDVAIRRLRKVGNEWQACSDNAKYPSKPLGEDDTILGRIWTVAKRPWRQIVDLSGSVATEESDDLDQRIAGIG